jgi:hypothetical protein
MELLSDFSHLHVAGGHVEQGQGGVHHVGC